MIFPSEYREIKHQRFIGFVASYLFAAVGVFVGNWAINGGKKGLIIGSLAFGFMIIFLLVILLTRWIWFKLSTKLKMI